MTGIPCELRAIMHIAAADPELQRKVLPYVDLDLHEIEWDRIFSEDLGSGHASAVRWMFAIWVGGAHRRDPFPQSYYMDSTLAEAVLEGLRIAWSIDA